jgi:prevent-host-death family protein
MERIGVRQLQQNASAAIQRVSRGDRLEVTERGRPVAILAPIGTGDPLAALQSSGRLTRAEEDLLALPAPVRRGRRMEPPSHHLARLRAEER